MLGWEVGFLSYVWLSVRTRTRSDVRAYDSRRAAVCELQAETERRRDGIYISVRHAKVTSAARSTAIASPVGKHTLQAPATGYPDSCCPRPTARTPIAITASRCAAHAWCPCPCQSTTTPPKRAQLTRGADAARCASERRRTLTLIAAPSTEHATFFLRLGGNASQGVRGAVLPSLAVRA